MRVSVFPTVLARNILRAFKHLVSVQQNTRTAQHSTHRTSRLYSRPIVIKDRTVDKSAWALHNIECH